MNRIQFVILLSGSTLVIVFLALQTLFAHQVQTQQVLVAQAQETVAQGRSCDTRLRQLVGRIYQVSQQTQDPGLKDLLTRQGFTVSQNPAPSSTSAPDSSPAPFSH